MVDFKNAGYDALGKDFADKKGGCDGRYGAWVDWHYVVVKLFTTKYTKKDIAICKSHHTFYIEKILKNL